MGNPDSSSGAGSRLSIALQHLCRRPASQTRGDDIDTTALAKVQDLGKHTGLSPALLSKIERGRGARQCRAIVVAAS
jgi:hypothetical protein